MPPFKRKFARNFLGVFLSAGILFAPLLFFPGCSTQNFTETNQSASGLLAERAFPEDTWLLLSFNTLGDEQRKNFDALMSRLSKDPEALREEFLSGIDANLESIDLSYLSDIQPILGQDGVRFVLGLSEGNGEKPAVHAALTLQDAQKAQQLLSDLEREGRFLKKTVNGTDLYFNAAVDSTTEEVFYFALFQDVLFVASGEDELLGMLNLIRSEDAVSLWSNPNYTKVIQKLPEEHLGLLFLDGELFAKRVSALDPSRLTSSLMRYLKGQGIVVLANEDGFAFRGYAQVDREKVKEEGIDLDRLKVKPGYLYKDIASEELALYLESYNFASILEQQFAAESVESGEQVTPSLFSLKAFLGADQFDLASFLGEGYAVALHQSLGFLPNFSLLFDVSGDAAKAQEFVTYLDAKFSNLVSLLQFQGGILAEALTKEVVQVEGRELNVLRLNLKAALSIYDPAGAYPFPESLKDQDMILVYGMPSEDRLIVSMDERWLTGEEKTPLSEDSLYRETFSHLKGFDRGIFYASLQTLSQYLEHFQELRDGLRADEPTPVEETIAADAAGAQPGTSTSLSESTEVESSIEPETVDFAEWLKLFKSFGFSSDFGWYDVEVGGVLLVE